MLTEIYIEALLVDEAWNSSQIDGFTAHLAWWLVVITGLITRPHESK